MAAKLSVLPTSRISPSPPSEPSLSGENAVEKPPTVWNKPSGDAACHVIVNEESWPALSECTKPQPKSTVDHPPGPSSKEHSISNPKKNKNHNRHNHRPNANQTSTPARQKSKRGGGSGSGPSRNGIIHHPRPLPPPRFPPPAPATPLPLPLPPYPIYEGFGPLPPPMPFFFPPSFNGNNWDRGSTPMNDRSFQRNFNAGGNYVGRPRGYGAANSVFVSRRDYNRDRNGSHRGFARPARSPAPPPPPLPYFPLPPVRPFRDPIGFDLASPYVDFPRPPSEFFMRFPPPPPPLYVPPMDPALPSNLVKQIDHYFSDDNLAKDLFLRARMDDEGWVDIAFIADFPKVRKMTQNLRLILDSLKDSTTVEVQGHRIRRRNDWRKWLMPVPQGLSAPAHVGSAEGKLSKSLENVKLGDETNPIDVVKVASSSSNVAQSDVAS